MTNRPTEHNEKSPRVTKPASFLREPQEDDRWLRFWSTMDRFGWDVLAVLLFLLSLLSLLGMTGLTEGTWVGYWTHLLQTGFGLGSIFVIAFLAFLGFLALRRHFPSLPGFGLGRTVSLELLALVLIALFALFDGLNMTDAEAGSAGGVVGWGLATLFSRIIPPPLITILLVIAGIVLAIHGFGLMDYLTRLVEGWPSIEHAPQGPITDESMPVDEQSETPQRPSKPLGQKPKSSGHPVPSLGQAEAPKALPVLERDDRLPPLNLLINDQTSRPDEEAIRATALQIEQSLAEFGVPARVVGYRVGPTVTQYAVEPGFTEKSGSEGEVQRQKVRVAQIANLSRDLALALSADRLRIEAPVPGRSYVGIEVPNQHNSIVRLRPLLESEAFQRLASPLAIALGRDVSGAPVVADLARMPHLLIAGTTGSGKSVCIAALTSCLVMNNAPSDLRIAMLDPKMVELVRFNGLPHLLGNVETEQARMLGVLNWALAEMDNRYRLLEDNRARDLDAYNRKMQRRKQETLPRIVILIDELADLMMSNPDQTEHSLVRLAQMARATGIHLVLATQRPSTDVVTGLIKANFSARIAFTVASSVDSRVILDMNGAETLLGKGDMLFLNPEVGTPQRAQGVIVTDHEVKKVVSFWQKMSPAEETTSAPWEDMLVEPVENSDDGLIEQAIGIVSKSRHASASMLQRRLRIGYPRAARLIDELEERGVVGPAQVGGREREVLVSEDDDTEPQEEAEEQE
jgi:S-DNA-T family DNA segregation ATPase FtsK/SpoIIIE